MYCSSGWPLVLLLILSQVVVGGKFHIFLSFGCLENVEKVQGSLAFYWGPHDMEKTHMLLGTGANVGFHGIEENLLREEEFLLDLQKKDWLIVDFDTNEGLYLSSDQPYGIIIKGCTNCGPFVVSSRETASQFGGCNFRSALTCSFDKNIILHGNGTEAAEEDEDKEED